MRYPQSDNDVATAVTEDTPNKLKDPTCNDKPEDLVLDESKLHKSGVTLICSKQDQDHFVFTESQVIIKKGNTCALLCNFRHVLTIEPKLQLNEVAVNQVINIADSFSFFNKDS